MIQSLASTSPALRIQTATMVPKTIAAEVRPAVEWSQVPIVDSRLRPPNDWTIYPADRELSPTLRIEAGTLVDENGVEVCPSCSEGPDFCACVYVFVALPRERRLPHALQQRSPEQIVRTSPVNAGSAS
jgi:hypothetical protein